MNKSSSWTALKNPAFRRLWIATVISGTCVAAHDSAMALVHQPEAFFVVAALAGVEWTMSASELWVATQRTIPSWARGRMNAAVIMISQGAMALGGLIWGWAATIAGPSSALLGAATLFLTSLLLSRRLSISVTTNFQESVSGYLCGCVEEVPPTTLTTELLAA